MTGKKQNEAYFQSDYLWNGGKAVKQQHKIISICKKDVKPWLVKQVLC